MRNFLFLLLVFTTVSVNSAFAASNQEWSETETMDFQSHCTNTLTEQARVGYYDQAQRSGNSSPKPFPVQAVTEMMSKLCECVADQASEAWSFEEFQKDYEKNLDQISLDAMASGVCRPDFGGIRR